MSSLSVGIILAIVAGIINGSFPAPIKYAKVWKWENIWAVWAVFGMVIFPWLILYLPFRIRWQVYQQGGVQNTMMLVAFGVGFGLAQILFGLGIAAVGMALNFAIAIGISTAFGSLLPLLTQASGQDLYAPGRHDLSRSVPGPGRNRWVRHCREDEGRRIWELRPRPRESAAVR